MDFSTVKANLEKKGYKVSCFETKEDAAAYIKSNVNGKTIGIGGSASAQQMDLYHILSENNTVYSHAYLPEGKTVAEIRLEACRSEVYISSVNGIAETGELVNIDNTGNRLAGTLYGPEKVYLLVGNQKITKNLDEAIYYARNVASPKNAQRLKRKTPCAVKGDKCYNCQSEERICRALCVFWEKPTGCNYEIILVNEELGY